MCPPPSQSLAQRSPSIDQDTAGKAAQDKRQAEQIWRKVTRAEQKLELMRNLKDEGVGTKKVEDFLGELERDKLTRSRPGETKFQIPRINQNTTGNKDNAMGTKGKRKTMNQLLTLKEVMRMKVKDAEKDWLLQKKEQNRIKLSIKKEFGRRSEVTKGKLEELRRVSLVLQRKLRVKNKNKLGFLVKK